MIILIILNQTNIVESISDTNKFDIIANGSIIDNTYNSAIALSQTNYVGEINDTNNFDIIINSSIINNTFFVGALLRNLILKNFYSNF